MRTLLFLILCFVFVACNNNGTSHRPSYVISKSSETAAEMESVKEPQAD